MNLTEFQELIRGRPEFFNGVHPETSASLASAERLLGFSLPDSLKWLLTEWGYSEPCGIASLDESVTLTLQCRKLFQLPVHYLILNDWGDGGVVYLDMHTGIIRWGDGGDLLHLTTEEPRSGVTDTYEDYPAWVNSRLENAFLPPE